MTILLDDHIHLAASSAIAATLEFLASSTHEPRASIWIPVILQALEATTTEPTDHTTMPTRADRKHLDAAVAAFHPHYASDANLGNERWYASL